jgi:uncharacterized protein YndB with AHSA1/START domain
VIDVNEQLNAVTRTVGSRLLPAGQARVLTVSRTYSTTLQDLWQACTDPDRIPRWFLPISGELKVGGHYQFEGNAGGTIERCDPPHGFEATWEYGGDVSWIQVRLSAEPDGRTRFELEHVASVEDERWTEFGPGAVGIGWEMGLLGLELYVAAVTGSGGDADAQAVSVTEAGAAWAASAEGKQFMAQSSERWAAASIAAGTDEAAARAAAERTTAAYTGG